MQRKLDFFIIGAMKSGSSSLRASLTGHPDISVLPKESHFFSKIGKFQQGFDWYNALVDEMPQAAHYGEKSPDYAPSPTAAARIRDYNPDARIIYIMRDPVKRAISHYQHAQRRRKGEARQISEEIEARDWEAGEDYAYSYVYRSQYDRHIAFWQEAFGREQLLLLVFEEVLQDPARWLGVAQDFLGVARHPLEWGHNNPTKPRIRSAFSATEAEVAGLRALLAPHVAAVEDILGRPIPAWHAPAETQAPSTPTPEPKPAAAPTDDAPAEADHEAIEARIRELRSEIRRLKSRQPSEAQRSQGKSSTSYNRYPGIFRTAQEWALGKWGPGMNYGRLRILSFGCADGTEMSTLRAYFPSAFIQGCDLDEESFLGNRPGRRAGRYFMSHPEAIVENGPYDLIFAHSVLCKHPVSGDIADEFPFSRFQSMFMTLHESLSPGGLMSLFNSSYFFRDLPIAHLYRPVRSPLVNTNGWVPKWSPAHQLCIGVEARRSQSFLDPSLTIEDTMDCLFEKTPGEAIEIKAGTDRPDGVLTEIASRRILSSGCNLTEILYSTDAAGHWMCRQWSMPDPAGGMTERPAWWEPSVPESLADGVPSVLGQTTMERTADGDSFLDSDSG